MEADQSNPAAESAASGTAEPTASAPSSSGGGPNSWEAAFADDPGASNRGTEPTPAPADPAPPAASAPSDKDGASKPDGAPAGKDGESKPGAEADKPSGQREPQPGSRRSTAAELDAARTENEALKAQFEAWARERDELAKTQAEREANEARAKAEAESAVEGILGKPGEMAALLSKLEDHHNPHKDVVFDADDEARLVELTRGAKLYQPLLDRARAEARAELGQHSASRVAEAEGRANAMLGAWAGQIEDASKLDLPGLDPGKFVGPDSVPVPDLIRHAHAAGASSRDGEIAELKGQLTDAKARAFTSQPHLATGGVSGNGRTERGYDPTKTPVGNLADLFAEEAAPAGRR